MAEGAEMLALVSSVPESVLPFMGRINDCDSHEMIPAQCWADEFGHDPAIVDFADVYTKHAASHNMTNNLNAPGFTADDVPIDHQSIWKIKGATAPSGRDISRREELMDLLGVKKQLVFSSAVGLLAACIRTKQRTNLGVFDLKGADPIEFSDKMFDAHNNWCVKAQKVSDRLFIVPIVQGKSPSEVYDKTKDLIDRGARVVEFLQAELLGGLSPAHSDHDPLWELLASRNVTATLHIGADGSFLKTDEWCNAPFFQGFKKGAEISMDPWTLSSIHLAAQNYVATMVVGGVFERHPNLRLGVVELAAYWIGPLAYQLDVWARVGGVSGKRDASPPLPHKPSYYINRNVRVTPFEFEYVDEYIQMYGLEDVYCYASDFPHIEGGTDPMHKFAGRLERLGRPDMMEKFFVDNGAWLLPD